MLALPVGRTNILLVKMLITGRGIRVLKARKNSHITSFTSNCQTLLPASHRRHSEHVMKSCLDEEHSLPVICCIITGHL